MSRLQKFSFWTSASFVPGMSMLLRAGSVAGYVQLVAMLVTFAYHYTSEKRFLTVDCAMASVVMGCNAGMVLWTRHIGLTLAGVALLPLAIWVWHRAGKSEGTDSYYAQHGVWHLLCGVINIFFALGYT